jgi:hypothetical protein
MSRHALVSLAIAAAALAVGCGDPVHDALVDALGPETTVPRGPLHRAGQPCLVCHDGAGPGRMVFSVAGTVYEHETSKKALAGGTVQLTDATGAKHIAQTNCAGNFFVQQVDWDPTFPLHVALAYGALTQKMTTHIGRDGGCATCHSGVVTSSSLAHVWLADDTITVGSSCK